MDDAELRDWMRRIEERLDRIEEGTTPTQAPWERHVMSHHAMGCVVCGLRWEGPLGYVCTRLDCPSGVRCSSSVQPISNGETFSYSWTGTIE